MTASNFDRIIAEREAEHAADEEHRRQIRELEARLREAEAALRAHHGDSATADREFVRKNQAACPICAALASPEELHSNASDRRTV